MNDERKLKILHVLQSSKFSGAENVVCQIIEMFSDDINYEMSYCSKYGDIKDSIEKRGIEYVGLKSLSISELYKAVKKYKPDILHAHDVTASVVAAGLPCKIKIIATIHGNHENSRRLSLKSLAFLFASIRINHIFWVSDSAYNSFYKSDLLKNKSSILYNVVNKNEVLTKAQADKRNYGYDIIYCGRLTYPKHPERLIDIGAELYGIYPDFKMGIIGDGELRDTVIAKIKYYKLQNNIEILGQLSNPMKAIQDSKVMLMTSRYEGTPMAALEAMALGVPIVTTPTDGLIRLIKNNYNGFISNDNKKIAHYIYCILSDTSLRNELAENMKRKFEEINDIEMYKRTIRQIYQSVGDK